MKNSKALFLDLVNQIKIGESRDEIQNMVYIILENLLSISRTDLLAEKEIMIGEAEEKKIIEVVQRVNNHEPIQYIFGEAEFYGRRFIVNPSVLIPRPETEELVRSILSHINSLTINNRKLRILDIGTGSGCIPITLALEIPGSAVFATDVSAIALDVATKNAFRSKAKVEFFKNDILKEEIPLSNLDVVVSNPPYIAFSEKETMRNNVLSFEPHLALFVPDDDPLVFYRTIAVKAQGVLQSKGLLAVEINERYGNDVALLLKDCGFTGVQVVNDLAGKERIVKGILR